MSGVVGIYGQERVASKLFYGLSSLQHRGQEGAGMTVSNGEELKRVKSKGLVMEVFSEEKLMDLAGSLGIGHVRYSTGGAFHEYNCEPLMAFARGESISLAYDGSLINSQILRTRLEEEGMMFQTTNDAEVILYLITRYYQGNIVEAIQKTASLIKGSYCVVLLLKDQLVAFRDHHGIRPLVLGQDEEGYIIASENAPIDIMGGEVLRDVQPGEILLIDQEGVQSYFMKEEAQERNCVFEYVYFARNDATLDGVNAYMFRRRTGEILWQEKPVEADLVIPVPDSGVPSAMGYAQESGIPLAEGLVKNRYVGRSFIKPTAKEREMSVKLKLNPLSHVVEGKDIVLLDDSIVRGTTSKNLIHRLKKAGARKVHLRVTSPPIANPCYYGIDTPSRSNLIAAQYKIEEIEEMIGADSLAFISLEGFEKAARKSLSKMCLACFNGDYPVDPVII
ncbi:MAG: amidophosphoribosyltransferase [Tissierellia bacterium]|nr:amidophosphoribosyltransferase [Tissierellia bacterium]